MFRYLIILSDHLLLSKYWIKMQRRALTHKKWWLLLFVIVMLTQRVIRNIWVHPLNSDHNEKGELYQLYADLHHYPTRFFKIYQMSVCKFDKLLNKIAHLMLKKETNFRSSISPEQQLVLTFRWVFPHSMIVWMKTCSKYCFKKPKNVLFLSELKHTGWYLWQLWKNKAYFVYKMKNKRTNVP